VHERLDGVIAFFTTQLADLDREIAATIQQDAVWADAATRLQTIPGIGLLTSVCLLVATLNFTTCATPEALAAYAGLAPHPQHSGTSVAGHTGVGQYGHARLRTVLYLATLIAARYNPAIKPFYDRLRARGKAPKVARCAAARKLLHIAWAVATKEQPFDPCYHARQVAQIGAAPAA
jgi:transposase